MSLFQVIKRRVENLVAAGVACVLVGDLNVSPYPVDSCKPDLATFSRRPDRKLLRTCLMENGGCMVDAFRLWHPDRWG